MTDLLDTKLLSYPPDSVPTHTVGPSTLNLFLDTGRLCSNCCDSVSAWLSWLVVICGSGEVELLKRGISRFLGDELRVMWENILGI